MFNRANNKSVNFNIGQVIEDACSSLIESSMSPQGLAVMAVTCAAITGVCYLALLQTEEGDEFAESPPSMRP